MRIGLDARTLGGRFTGDRTYWRGLIGGLAQIDADSANRYLLYLREPLDAEAQSTLPPNFSYRILPARSDRTWSLAALPAAAKADKINVMHVQYTVSPLFSMPVVTTVHDISFRLFPELFSLKDRTLLNLSVPAAIRKSCGVIGVSENTRRDIIHHYHPDPHKVVAIPLAAGSEFRQFSELEKDNARRQLNESYSLDGPYALAVGVLQPRKNLPMLLKAFQAAKRIAGFPHKLVVVGKRGWLTEEIDAALQNISAEDIILTGYVPDDHLPVLYARADVMCYPSLYEGFGLPPLEAMACGCPVIVGNTSSLPEVVGNAAILLDPLRPGDWIDAIGQVLCDPERRKKMSVDGIAQAGHFAWTRTAEQTLAVYRACHNS